jgi:hypothetical protein
MDKKDYDLKLWSYVQSDSTFFNLSIDEVSELLEKDLSIDEGIKALKELKDPEKPEEPRIREITKEGLENNYVLTEAKGEESTIYMDKNEHKKLTEELKEVGELSKIKNNYYVYKLADPKCKKPRNDRFNEIIIYYILQDYLFNEFRYEDIKIYDYKMFVRQKLSKSQEPKSLSDVRSLMNVEYKHINENWSWIKDIKDIRILIEDLNQSNCRINGSKLEIFDSILRIDYEQIYKTF